MVGYGEMMNSGQNRMKEVFMNLGRKQLDT